MKKLMIVAAILGMAGLSQAASVDWKISSANTSIATLKGKTYYVFNGDFTTAIAAAFADTTDGGVAAFNDFLGSTTPIGSGTSSKASTSSTYQLTGPKSGISDTLTVLILNDSLADGKTYQLGTIATDGYVYMASPEGQETSPGNVTFSYTGAATGTIAAKATPGPTPVPEPTSGLLMLLGVAGLALRRRRA